MVWIISLKTPSGVKRMRAMVISYGNVFQKNLMRSMLSKTFEFFEQTFSND